MVKPLTIAFCTCYIAVSFGDNDEILLGPRLKLAQDISANGVVFDHALVDLVLACLKLGLDHS